MGCRKHVVKAKPKIKTSGQSVYRLETAMVVPAGQDRH